MTNDIRKAALKVLYIGNFRSPYSTENDLKWTFEHLGHTVTALQEDETSVDQVLFEHSMHGHDLVLYTHTHGWNVQGDLDKAWRHFKLIDVPTASFHLDRFWGLDVLDQREARIGLHAFWRTQHVFTADGGDHDWKGKGVNHHWLKPGVVERDCKLGNFRTEYACDVAFVGSKHYHPEYPERGQLIDWLQETYGDRFRRFAGDTPTGTVRGQDLNDVYASVKVVVGDSCFAQTGVENYWSDRVAETTGRGGFLIHPEVEGLDHQGIKRFQGYEQLQRMIDFWLYSDGSREVKRKEGFNWTKKNATYTHRVNEMLNTIFE